MKRTKLTTTKLTPQENERMEQRILVLKEMMSAEKAIREIDGGIHWESVKAGQNLAGGNHNHVNPSDLFTSPFAKAGTKKQIKVKFLNEKQEEKPESKPALRCGQCGKKLASLACVECGEDYCQLCYARMHQRGAMAFHRVKPLAIKFRPLPPDVEPGAKVTPTAPEDSTVVCETGMSTEAAHEEAGGSLLKGSYDEKTSAESFQDALKEWRNGRNKVAMESKESSVNSHSASVNSGGMQAGEGLLPHSSKDITISFPSPEAPRISYFERLLLQKCRESPGNNPFQESNKSSDTTLENFSKKVTENAIFRDLTDDEEVTGEEASEVSEYNIFYHNDDDVATVTANEKMLQDFSRATPSTEILIKDTCPTDDVSPSISKTTAKINNGTCRNGAVLSTLKNPPLPPSKPISRGKTNRPTKTVTGKMKRAQKEKKVQVTKTKKQDTQSEQNRRVSSDVAVKKKVSEEELARSVKLAWVKCGGESSCKQTLGVFFLHGVDPIQDLVDNSAKCSNLPTDCPNMTFMLGKPTWSPSERSMLEGNQSGQMLEDAGTASTTILGEPNQVKSIDIEEKQTLDSSTPITCDKACTPINSGFQDPYYDEDGSDSEQEYEREKFICSRLGNSEESAELLLASRPATAVAARSEKEDEEEEEMEREQEDCYTLENLASELLASTVEFERCMTASRLEEEEDVGGADNEDLILDDSLGDDLDVSRIQSDFDLFQRKMIDQDSD